MLNQESFEKVSFNAGLGLILYRWNFQLGFRASFFPSDWWGSSRYTGQLSYKARISYIISF